MHLQSTFVYHLLFANNHTKFIVNERKTIWYKFTRGEIFEAAMNTQRKRVHFVTLSGHRIIVCRASLTWDVAIHGGRLEAWWRSWYGWTLSRRQHLFACSECRSARENWKWQLPVGLTGELGDRYTRAFAIFQSLASHSAWSWSSKVGLCLTLLVVVLLPRVLLTEHHPHRDYYYYCYYY